MAKNSEVLTNIARNSVKSRNFERTVLEVLIENGLTTEEEFETKLKLIYKKNVESDFTELLEANVDEEKE